LSAKIGKKSLKFVGLLGFSEAQPKNATAFWATHLQENALISLL
jgi:hypothetical protein